MPSPIRIQEYAVGIFNGAFTKSALKKALKKKYIRVNEVIATSATFIEGGEVIKLTIPEKVQPKKTLILPLEVLFEDDYLAAISKPAGIVVSGNSFKTIANALTQNLKRSNLPDATLPQPVHRLDYPTTGIVLVGKTSESIRIFNKKFADKEIDKVYYAIAIGNIKSQGLISSEIDGKEALTKYILCESVPSKRFGQLNLLQLTPKTGKRHQIRKHLASIGNPILGDKEYGAEDLILKGKGMYLHAFSLKFTHPFTKQPMYLKDTLPKRFLKIFPQAFTGVNIR